MAALVPNYQHRRSLKLDVIAGAQVITEVNDPAATPERSASAVNVLTCRDDVVVG